MTGPAKTIPDQTHPAHTNGPGRRLEDRLAEPFAFALVTWPAAFAATRLTVGDESGWLISALLWLAVFHLAAYGRGRGVGFGNVMLVSSGVVALAAWGYPSPWCWGAFPLLLIALHGAQRACMRASGHDRGAAGEPDACDAPSERATHASRQI